MATKRTKGRQREAEEAGEATGEAILQSFYQDLVDEVDRKVKLSDVSTFSRDRMSTGMACIDLALGGGLAPGMYTFAGQEGSCKTTSILTALGSALRKGVPLVEMWDYEGCSLKDVTYRSDGQDIPLKNLFNLDEVNTLLGPRWIGQFAKIDTHADDHTIQSRTGQLYYGGKQEITRVTLEDGSFFEGYRHPFFVLTDSGEIIEKKLEELVEGDTLLLKKHP